MANRIEFVPELSEPTGRPCDPFLDRASEVLVMLMMCAISATTLIFLLILAVAVLWHAAIWAFG